MSLMKYEDIKKHLPNIIPAVIVFLIAGGFATYEYFQIKTLTENVGILAAETASSTEELSQEIASLRSQTSGLSTTLSNTQQNVASVQSQVGNVQQSVGSISGAVGTLQKLVTTDPELLKKYSKVYFLNENYTPAHLSLIPQSYVYSNTKQEQFLEEALPFLENMLTAAKSAGITIYVASAYRSFAEQQSLKSEYAVVYGAGTANSFSADQGYSEHQLGTATDLITPGLNGELTDAFDATTAYAWLLANAYKFGFELSYPKGNDYYVYEPWHWRFVGIKLATYLHNGNKNFYDLDQREIDTYLADLFD